MSSNIENTLFKLKNYITDNYIIFITFTVILILLTLIAKSKAKKKNKINSNYKFKNDPVLKNNNYKDLEDKEIIQEKAFEQLKELKIAKMNLDLDKIREITTDNVYELYKKQINTLILNKQKNIVQKIKYINSHIVNIIPNSNEKTINLRIIIECYDFIVDQYNNTSFKYNKKMLQTYEVEVKTKNNNYLIDKIQLLYEREL